MKRIYATSPLSYLIQLLDRYKATKISFEDAFKHTVELYSLNNKAAGMLESDYNQYYKVPVRFSKIPSINNGE